MFDVCLFMACLQECASLVSQVQLELSPSLLSCDTLEQKTQTTQTLSK